MRAWIAAATWVLAAGCSSFELELDVSQAYAPDAEVRIDHAAVAGGVYRATFASYDDARRAKTAVEVFRGGALVDTWVDAAEACAWLCAMHECPGGALDRARVDIVLMTDATIRRAYEGECDWDDVDVVFAP